MDLQKTWVTMLVFLLVAVIVWVGFSVYFSVTTVDINPNAQTYTSLLQAKFDTDTLGKVVERVEALPIKPATFLGLISEENSN